MTVEYVELLEQRGWNANTETETCAQPDGES